MKIVPTLTSIEVEGVEYSLIPAAKFLCESAGAIEFAGPIPRNLDLKRVTKVSYLPTVQRGIFSYAPYGVSLTHTFRSATTLVRKRSLFSLVGAHGEWLPSKALFDNIPHDLPPSLKTPKHIFQFTN